ncbi:MAG: flagellar biosynthesis anti-sigma factor FlgM [Erythrobacter sp.]|jgi:negative regulator of flagellin synthesis FlgM|nr:flagellar biosynthesis anti-sigma factor FlgM [Erythrobacter sp.]
MPSIEIGKTEALSALRAPVESDRAAPRGASDNAPRSPGSATTTGIALEVDTGFDASSPPLDADRVAEIRKALKDGRYPLVPAEIVDAMIAARLSSAIG